MVTTTTNSIEGQRIVKYKKVLTEYGFASGKRSGKDNESTRNVYDMSAEEFEEAFRNATSDAFSKLVAHAEELGANAIIGADTQYVFCGPDDENLMVIVKGTAVIVDVSYY